MKIRKAKWLKLLLIGTSVTAIGTIPLTITACSKKEAIVTPELKTSINGIGGLDQFITTSSKLSDVNQNLKNVLDMNKKSVITNWDSIPKNQQDSIVLNPTLSDWDENGFGNTSFSDWSSTSNPTLVTWHGINGNPNEEITFSSNKDLKELLTKNINEIVKNALLISSATSKIKDKSNNLLSNLDNKTFSLADSDIAVNENGDLLVGFVITGNQSHSSKLINKQTNSEQVDITNYALSIPSNVITFTPKINLEVTYGQQKTVSKNISISYEVSTNDVSKQTFNGDTNKDVIVLEEKNPEGEDKIGLWKTITDVGILKALGWIDNENDLSNHTNGDAISAEKLKREQIVSDLGITGLTEEKLLGIEIEMEQRDVNHANYNGEYSIFVSTLLPTENSNSDLNLDFAIYEIVAKSESKNTFNQLEVKVPNAYIIDTELPQKENAKEEKEEGSNTQYMTITKDFFDTPFEMGFKKEDSTSGANTLLVENKTGFSNADEAIKANLENSTIFDAFVKKIEKSAKDNGIYLYNGVDVSFQSNVWSRVQQTETITFNIRLKKGFSFKNAFNLPHLSTRVINKYNTENKTSRVTFAITLDNNSSKTRKPRNVGSADNGAILRKYAMTVEQIASQISDSSSKENIGVKNNN